MVGFEANALQSRGPSRRRFTTPKLLGGALVLALSLCAATAALPSQVQAQEEPGSLKDASPQDRPMMLSFFTGIHYGHFSGFGFPLTIGGRFYIPLVPDGFIPTLNDEFGVEFGLDLDIVFLSSIYTNQSVLFGFGVPADAMWAFHFSSKFDAYAKLGFVLGGAASSYAYGGFWWTFRSAIGLRLKITEGMYFRAEVGYPSILAGLGFAF